MAIIGDKERTAHLLRRFGLGASEAEVDYYGAGGWRNAVDRLLNYEAIPETVEFSDEFLKDMNGRMPPDPRPARTCCIGWLLTTNRPLQAKMTVFWHDHFATSTEKVANGPSMFRYWEILQEGATGNFRDLLLNISKSPAMLYWLDNIENLKGKPNENFAREVMELFTLGEGNYTEKDIQEAARAFTGWSYGTTINGSTRLNRREVPNQFSQYYLDFTNHDNGTKTVFGKSGSWNGDDVINILGDLPRTATYLTEKIWSWFVYPNPEKSTIAKHATAFQASGLEIKALLKSIMLDEETFSDRADRKVIKNPIDFCISTMRQLGHGGLLANQVKNVDKSDFLQTRNALAIARIPTVSSAAMGMEILTPPDVSGWPSGTQWISTSTMVERMKWSDSLFISNRGIAQASVAAVAPNGTSSNQLVENMLSIFDTSLPDSKKADLVKAASDALGGGRANFSNAAQACAKTSRLLFSTPEFQFM